MSARYVEVPRGAITGALKAAGFVEHDGRLTFDKRLFGSDGRELIFELKHRKRPFTVRVYTSLSRNAEVARPCGKDAIRVLLFFDGEQDKRFHLCARKFRVFRAGTIDGVVERMLERARECYELANEMPPCACGAVRYPGGGRCLAKCDRGVAGVRSEMHALRERSGS